MTKRVVKRKLNKKKKMETVNETSLYANTVTVFIYIIIGIYPIFLISLFTGNGKIFWLFEVPNSLLEEMVEYIKNGGEDNDLSEDGDAIGRSAILVLLIFVGFMFYVAIGAILAAIFPATLLFLVMYVFFKKKK